MATQTKLFEDFALVESFALRVLTNPLEILINNFLGFVGVGV